MRCVKTTQQEHHRNSRHYLKPATGCHNLLYQFQRGDLETFDKLYIEKYPHLFRLILWKMGSSLDIWEAEGIVQQVFLQIFIKAPTYNGQTDAEAWGWIWTIAHNQMIDVIRQKDAHEKGQVNLDDETCTSQKLDFDEKTIDAKNWLEKFINSLAPREQLLLKLLQDDLSQKEIAVQLKISLPRTTQIRKNIKKKALKFEK